MPLATSTIKGIKFSFFFRLFVYVSFALTLIVLDTKKQAFNPIKEKLSDFDVLINEKLSPIKTYADGLYVHFSSKSEIAKKHEELKQKQLVTDVQLQRLSSLENRLVELEELLNLKLKSNSSMFIATVIDASDSPYEQWLKVRFNVNAPISAGDYVVNGDGLAGQILSINEDTGLVRLISDQRASVHVEVLRTGFRAVLFGSGKYGLLKLKFVPESVDVKEGDVLITSGIGDQYPFGVPVGEVISVNKEIASSFSRIIVKTSADPISERDFLILTDLVSDDVFSPEH